jgi:hypothetical protein
MDSTTELSVGKKRRSSLQQHREITAASCSFCQAQPAALQVHSPTSVRPNQKHQPTTYFCLLHYYTTSAVRAGGPETTVRVVNPAEYDRQLPAMQSLFADVFVELQQELAEESAARSSFPTKISAQDPLAILTRLHQAPKKKLSAQKKRKRSPDSTSDATAGGFIESIALPERLIRTQRAQAQKQSALVRRMEHASKHSGSLTQRRKPTRKSIWNVMEDAAYRPAAAVATEKSAPPTSTAAAAAAATTTEPSFLDMDLAHDNNVTCSSCGSREVNCLSSSTHRNNESTKGEIWGSGSRDDVMIRYQCLQCGKVWSEQE